jgi:galactose-1-phosphate uridylyltransferase
MIQKSKPNYIYPILLWDFLPKGGASQVHPHLQCTINNDKYYGNFEMIRNGAESYFKATKNNYFNDFVKIHNNLGLSIIHKKSAIIFPLVFF